MISKHKKICSFSLNLGNKSKLENIVWPEILKMAEAEINMAYHTHGKKVVFLDAAVLLAAKWHEQCCHQVHMLIHEC